MLSVVSLSATNYPYRKYLWKKNSFLIIFFTIKFIKLLKNIKLGFKKMIITKCNLLDLKTK